MNNYIIYPDYIGYHLKATAYIPLSLFASDALCDTMGFKLVGPFDILAGRHKGVVKNRHNRKPNYLRHWRYYYDPPEFLTLISGDRKTQFHIGYFRYLQFISWIIDFIACRIRTWSHLFYRNNYYLLSVTQLFEMNALFLSEEKGLIFFSSINL